MSASLDIRDAFSCCSREGLRTAHNKEPLWTVVYHCKGRLVELVTCMKEPLWTVVYHCKGRLVELVTCTKEPMWTVVYHCKGRLVKLVACMDICTLSIQRQSRISVCLDGAPGM